MAHPILVTGAAGLTVTELLLKQGKAARAMVRNEDQRAQALRDLGAEVVIGDLLDLDSMHRVIAGCETSFFPNFPNVWACPCRRRRVPLLILSTLVLPSSWSHSSVNAACAATA